MGSIPTRIEEESQRRNFFRDISRHLTELGMPQGQVIESEDGTFLTHEQQMNSRQLRWDLNYDFNSKYPAFSLCWLSNIRFPTLGYIIGVHTTGIAIRSRPQIWHGWGGGTPETEKDPAITAWAKNLMEKYIAQKEWHSLDYVTLLKNLLDETRDEAWK